MIVGQASKARPMYPQASKLPGTFTGLFFALTLLTCSPRAFAQRPTGPPPAPQRGAGPAGLPVPTFSVDLLVNVRESGGTPLSASAMVKLYSINGTNRAQPTRDGATATFTQVLAGEYDIEVSAASYKTAKEHASVVAAGSTYTVYVYMHPESEGPMGSGGPPSTIMTPHLQSEIDKGLDEQRKRRFDEARKHFDKAAKMAPRNPDIQYLLGMLEYVQQHFPEARGKFEAALLIYPSHERSLLALGEVQLRTGDAVAAAKTLEKAYQVNGADWRTHFLLASAYLQLKDYEKAQPHATRATALAKERAAPAWLLLGQILAGEGKRDDAKRALETLLRGFPDDANAAQAKALLNELNKPAIETVSHVTLAAIPAPEPPAPAKIRPWAPPDIDSKEFPVVQDVACKESELLERTQAKTERQFENFEKFLATEHIEHQEIDAYGNPGPARTKDFNYIVFVEHPRPGMSFLNEKRDGGQNLDAFPTSLATQGLVGLGVDIFDPNFSADLDYKCEGLGEWRGQAAWRVRFEQKMGVPSQIRTWRNNRGVFPIALKGRVWIAASSYDVLHVETDLREPVAELQLSRDHLVVDYGPVNFEKGKTTLWLPWSAEMFMELRGKRYHHRHTLTNYMLFSVETGSTIGKPKTAPPQEQP